MFVGETNETGSGEEEKLALSLRLLGRRGRKDPYRRGNKGNQTVWLPIYETAQECLAQGTTDR